MPWWIAVSSSLIIHANVRSTGNRRGSEGSVEATPSQRAGLLSWGRPRMASVLLTVGPGILLHSKYVFISGGGTKAFLVSVVYLDG